MKGTEEIALEIWRNIRHYNGTVESVKAALDAERQAVWNHTCVHHNDVDRAEAAKRCPVCNQQHLGNLLARIHGDGWHYITEHGWENAVEDADKKVVAMKADLDEERAMHQMTGSELQTLRTKCVEVLKPFSEILSEVESNGFYNPDWLSVYVQLSSLRKVAALLAELQKEIK